MENQKHYLSNLQKPEINSLTEIVRLSRELPTVRNSDQNEVNNAILELVLDVFAFYNEIPNDIQTPLILQQTKEHFLGLTLADISVFKKHCLAGNYELKFRLTPNVFIDWIKEFKFERMEAFENANLKAKIEIEKQPISEKTTEMLKKLAETVKPQPLYSTDQPIESDRDKFIKKQYHYYKTVFNDFWISQGKMVTEQNKPFVNIEADLAKKKRFMFINEYCKMMVENDLIDYDKK